MSLKYRIKTLFGRGWDELVCNVSRHSGQLWDHDKALTAIESKVARLESRLASAEQNINWHMVVQTVPEEVKKMVVNSTHFPDLPLNDNQRDADAHLMIMLSRMLERGELKIAKKITKK